MAFNQRDIPYSSARNFLDFFLKLSVSCNAYLKINGIDPRLGQGLSSQSPCAPISYLHEAVYILAA